jgi:GAF domain-containing protein
MNKGTSESSAEQSRLAELAQYRVLDSKPDVVMLARLICEASIATITFVNDHRQWFKAVSGLDFCDSPIAESICAFTIKQAETFVIADLTADRRTRDMRIVTGEPFARFYAGVPLKVLSGARLGTICVIDTKVRSQGLTLNQNLSLEALARQVVVNIELRRALENGKSLSLTRRLAFSHNLD